MSGNTQPEINRATGAGRVAHPDEGFVSEMFCSLQGEGPYVGERQIFLRTAGCELSCSWCDTLYSKVRTPRFVIHDDERRALPNPMRAGDVLAELHSLAAANPGVVTVSVTGGEPLEQPEFTGLLVRGIREAGLRVYLETAGLHAAELKALIERVDVVAMDIKLPSSFGRDVFDRHREFLKVLAESDLVDGARQGRAPAAFVKIVVDTAATLDEIETAARLVADADRRLLLVLQPESDALLSHRTPREETAQLLRKLEHAQQSAGLLLDDVRVVPQCHKILGVR